MTAEELGVVRLASGVRGIALRTPTLPPATTTWCWLLGSGPEGLLVEPASPWPEEQRRLEAALGALRREEGFWPREALLTHLHPDHVGGAEAIRALGIPLAAHRLTAEAVAERGIRVDRTVEDGEPFRLGEEPEQTWTALHTPGHARGHLALIQASAGRVVAGDLVAGEGTVVIDPPEGDLADYLASLERLRALGARTLLPAHGPVIEDGQERLLEYVRHRMERERQVIAALAASPGRTARATDLVPGIYAAVPRALWPVAARSVLAHLLKLERQGWVARDGPERFQLVVEPDQAR